MRILVISYIFWPDVQPRSIRWQAITNHWSSIGHHVSVITATQSNKDEERKNNDVEIIRVPENWIGNVRNKLSGSTITTLNPKKYKSSNEHDNNPKQESDNIKLKKIIKAIYELTLRKLHWPDYAWTWIANAKKETLSLLDSEDSYDVIISVSHPFSSHLVGHTVKRKYPDIKWIIDMGDPFCFLEELPPNNFFLFDRLNKKIEGACFDDSDGVVVTTPETKQEYSRLFPKEINKIKVIPPLLSPDVSSSLKNNQRTKSTPSNIIKLVFLGTLYSEIRHPEGLLKLLNAASKKLEKKLQIHFVGPTNNVDISSFSFPNISINFHGRVGRDIVLKYLLDADFLINIGNSTHFSLPSKLVEYVSTGKPILNISSIEQDTSSRFLSSYPMSKTVLLKGAVTNQMVKEVVDYLNSALSIDLNYNDFSLKKYETPNIAKEYEDLLG